LEIQDHWAFVLEEILSFSSCLFPLYLLSTKKKNLYEKMNIRYPSWKFFDPVNCFYK
jgi:hypothetical protein